jgi:hypothetical protein
MNIYISTPRSLSSIIYNNLSYYNLDPTKKYAYLFRLSNPPGYYICDVVICLVSIIYLVISLLLCTCSPPYRQNMAHTCVEPQTEVSFALFEKILRQNICPHQRSSIRRAQGYLKSMALSTVLEISKTSGLHPWWTDIHYQMDTFLQSVNIGKTAFGKEEVATDSYRNLVLS